MSNEQLNSDMAMLDIEPKLDSGWEMIARKSKKGSPASNSKSSGSSTLSADAKPWVPSVSSNAKASSSSTARSNTKAWDSSTRTNANAWGTSAVSSNANAWGTSAVSSNANAWGASAMPSDANGWGTCAVSSNARAWGPSTVTSNPKSMAKDSKDSNGGGRDNRVQAYESCKTHAPNHSRKGQTKDVTAPHAVAPPLENGWQWPPIRAGSQYKTAKEQNKDHADNELFSIQSVSLEENSDNDDSVVDDDSGDDNIDDDDDDEDLLEDSDFDSDASEKSHDTRKNHKWFRGFFDALDSLSEEQITAPDRQWHCPACHDGPGAIDWYKGLLPVVSHAKTMRTRRVKLHREFAELLEEEVRRRGGSIFPSRETFGKWRGLRETVADKDIVWPPMVMVRNTVLEKDEKEKWIGMGNQELVDYFSNYAAVRARHSYGPHGHRGMSVLMFEPSPTGYLEAERLHKHFADEGRDREAWILKKTLFYPGGKRILYGYLTTKEDLEAFNQHSAGKSRLKYEIKSYLEMVVNPMRKMDEDNQKLNWYKNKAVKQEKRCKAYEESFEKVTQKLKETLEDNHIVRLRTKMQQKENKEEMDYQEQFLKQQMEKVHIAIEEKEQEFEKVLQQERAKAKQSENIGSPEGHKRREEEINDFISRQEKGMAEFVAEREKLIKQHEDMNVELKRKYLEEKFLLEKKLDAELTDLMLKFAPSTFKSSSTHI